MDGILAYAYTLNGLELLPGMHCQAESVSGPTASTDMYQVKRRTEATRPLETGVSFRNLARKQTGTYNPPKRKVNKMPTLSLQANWILQIVGSGKSSITTSTITLGTWRRQYMEILNMALVAYRYTISNSRSDQCTSLPQGWSPRNETTAHIAQSW